MLAEPNEITVVLLIIKGTEFDTHLWQAIRGELDLSMPQLDAYPLPVPMFSGELAEGLYESARDCLEQIEAYKHFQGKLQ